MASILRQIVAGPRARHPEAGLDLCYVTDFIIATSGPSSTYPQRAYRNPTDELVKFLDCKHGTEWSIWEFRAEGTGYPDSEVYHRIRHYPWPDHHPPPFALIPNIMASMRAWLKGPEAKEGRVVVVHCKAGKGRSGTIACSYLISQEGWTIEDAVNRFTERRMRSGFGIGISIPSQQRWIRYVDYWAKHGKIYVDRPIEILEIHAWGLRDGVKVAVDGYIEEGRKIKTFHTFTSSERTDMEGDALPPQKTSNDSKVDKDQLLSPDSTTSGQNIPTPLSTSTTASSTSQPSDDSAIRASLFRPSSRIILPNSDINIDVERRNKAKYGFTMVTSVAHVWFNPIFESQMSSSSSSDTTTAPTIDPADSEAKDPPAAAAPSESTSATPPTTIDTAGVFTITWDAMDGVKGSSQKGKRALDRLSVVWRAIDSSDVAPNPNADAEGEEEALPLGKIITQPASGEPVPDTGAADWHKAHEEVEVKAPGTTGTGTGIIGGIIKELGLRADNEESVDVSRASSVKSAATGESKVSLQQKTKDGSKSGIGTGEGSSETESDWAVQEGVKAHGPDGEEYVRPYRAGEEGVEQVKQEKGGAQDPKIEDVPVVQVSEPEPEPEPEMAKVVDRAVEARKGENV